MSPFQQRQVLGSIFLNYNVARNLQIKHTQCSSSELEFSSFIFFLFYP
jgi:hypothetical protein